MFFLSPSLPSFLSYQSIYISTYLSPSPLPLPLLNFILHIPYLSAFFLLSLSFIHDFLCLLLAILLSPILPHTSFPFSPLSAPFPPHYYLPSLFLLPITACLSSHTSPPPVWLLYFLSALPPFSQFLTRLSYSPFVPPSFLLSSHTPASLFFLPACLHFPSIIFCSSLLLSSCLYIPQFFFCLLFSCFSPVIFLFFTLSFFRLSPLFLSLPFLLSILLFILYFVSFFFYPLLSFFPPSPGFSSISFKMDLSFPSLFSFFLTRCEPKGELDAWVHGEFKTPEVMLLLYRSLA